MIRNLCCTVTIESVLANSKTQNTFLFTVNAIFSRLPPSGETSKYAMVSSTKKTWSDSVPIDMLLSAVSVLVVAQSSSEIPEGLMNNPVHEETFQNNLKTAVNLLLTFPFVSRVPSYVELLTVKKFALPFV